MNSDQDVNARLDRLRGRAMPVNHNARTISALAANPGCPRRALLDAASVDKMRIAAHVGYPPPFGQSRFAITRGSAFEARVTGNGAAELLTLLRDLLGLDVSEVGYTDFNDVGGGQSRMSREVRHLVTRHALTGRDHGRRTLFDHPMLRLRVGGRHAYLEPDLIALRPARPKTRGGSRRPARSPTPPSTTRYSARSSRRRARPR